MKVIVKIKKQDEDDGARVVIEVDGKREIHAGSCEPEDATVERDLNFVYNIVPLMRRAYNVGARGEDFSVEEIPMEEE